VSPDVKEHVWDSEIALAGVQPEVVELLVSALATLLELEHGLVPDFLALRLLVESKVMTGTCTESTIILVCFRMISKAWALPIVSQSRVAAML
jgi:hypothetical protein